MHRTLRHAASTAKVLAGTPRAEPCGACGDCGVSPERHTTSVSVPRHRQGSGLVRCLEDGSSIPLSRALDLCRTF